MKHYSVIMEPAWLEEMKKRKREKGVTIQFQIREAIKQYLKS